MQEKLCAVNYPTKLARLATLCHPSCTFWSMLQPIFNCPYPLDQSYLSLSCHLPPLCMLPGCINLLQQLLIALDFPCWQGGSVQLWGSFPISTHSALHGLLSVACPEVSYPNGHAVAGFGGRAGAIPTARLPLAHAGAWEHKRVEISTAFVSAVEVMMTIHCCRCVHIE